MQRGRVTRADDGFVARNYSSLPVSITSGEGVWVQDVDGKRYLDFLSAYSALNFGHRHPRIIEATRKQLDRITLVGRAFENDLLAPFCRSLAEFCGMEVVVPMNTGAEAVETALKVARRWGYEVKGVPENEASVIVCDGNFHGRTTTIVGFSSNPEAREGFGPFAPGFTSVPYGSVEAIADAIDDSTVAVLIEPIQGEAGVIIPPDGYLRAIQDHCRKANVLLIADEVQSGLGRTGRSFACQHEDVQPDIYVLGKALGGGVLPVSAVVSRWDVLGVLTPGSHGSTFGGNPLACAIGLEVIAMLETGEYQQRAAELGAILQLKLSELVGNGVEAARVRGLWAGVDLAPGMPPADEVCQLLSENGVLMKDAHDNTIRMSPPLVIQQEELVFGLERFGKVVRELWSRRTTSVTSR